MSPSSALPPFTPTLRSQHVAMSSSLIFRIIYAFIAILGASLTVVRLRAGDWLAALWPALIAAFCIYRFFTFSESE
jgi:hypothetical protein